VTLAPLLRISRDQVGPETRLTIGEYDVSGGWTFWCMFIRLRWVSDVARQTGSADWATLGCRRYFRLAPVPFGAVLVGSGCLLLLSGPESSLRYEPAVLPARARLMGSGLSEDCPRDSAMAR